MHVTYFVICSFEKHTHRERKMCAKGQMYLEKVFRIVKQTFAKSALTQNNHVGHQTFN